MKIVSFNVNGLRARFHQLQILIDQHRPDIIGLQETKVHDSEFPLAVITDMGYQVVYHGQKAHYGVATLSRLDPLDVQKGFAAEDPAHQRRLLITSYRLADGRRLRVINGYFPQGENRKSFPAKRPFMSTCRTGWKPRPIRVNCWSCLVI